MAYKTISMPSGFIGWGDQPGQTVEGRLIDFSPDGGTDYAGNPCPQVTLELVAPAASYDKAGTRTDFPAGEEVAITCGQVRLRAAARQLGRTPLGSMVLFEMTGTRQVSNGTMKEFTVSTDESTADVQNYNSTAATSAPAPSSSSTVQAVAPAAAAPMTTPKVAIEGLPEGVDPALVAALQAHLSTQGRA